MTDLFLQWLDSEIQHSRTLNKAGYVQGRLQALIESKLQYEKKESMKQVLEIHHAGELVLRLQVDGKLSSAEIFGQEVSVIGRPELVDKLPPGLKIMA